MKTLFLISSATIVCFFTSCTSTRLYSYPLNDTNKTIIKRIFTSGVVSCTDGYCWQIVKEQNIKNTYIIDGSRILFMDIKLKAEEKTPKEFTVNLRVTNLGIRYRKIEIPFLNELESALFKANESLIKEQVAQTVNEIQEKSKKEKQ